jgi:hypothetical protein
MGNELLDNIASFLALITVWAACLLIGGLLCSFLAKRILRRERERFERWKKTHRIVMRQ